MPAPLTAPAAAVAAETEDKRAATAQREEKLRGELKRLARAPAAPAPASVIAPLTPLHEALLIRFARSGEANLFAASLAAALDSPVDLGERILLDISGRQMAIALTGLGMARADSLSVLSRFYPHLAERLGGATRADALLAELAPEESMVRIAGWLAAERKNSETGHQPYLAPARGPDPRQPAARQDSSRGMAEVRKKRSFFSRSN